MAGKSINKRERYTVDEMCDALEVTNGLIFLAAKRIGCTSATIRRYIDTHPEVRLVFEEAKGELCDIAERSLRVRLEEGDLGAITFVLRTLGKDRGYTEKIEQEITHTFGTIRVPVLEDGDDWEAVVKSQMDSISETIEGNSERA